MPGLTNEAHTSKPAVRGLARAHQSNAGFSLKAKGSRAGPTAGRVLGALEGLRPRGPSFKLRDATRFPIPVQPGWVGSSPLTAGRRDHSTPFPVHGNPPKWGVRESVPRIQVTTPLEVQPASGTRVCSMLKKPRPPQVYRFQEHHSIRKYVGIVN